MGHISPESTIFRLLLCERKIKCILFVTVIAVSLSVFTAEPLRILGDWPCGGGDTGQGGHSACKLPPPVCYEDQMRVTPWGPKCRSTFPGILSLLGGLLYYVSTWSHVDSFDRHLLVTATCQVLDYHSRQAKSITLREIRTTQRQLQSSVGRQL